MKKIIISFLLTATAFFAIVFSFGAFSKKNKADFQVAMVTDFTDVNDASFNQSCFEGGKEWCRKNNIKFTYYKPSSLSLAERVKSIKLAIDRGYNVILCPGYALGEAIAEVAPKHKDVKFIGLDISQDDFPEGFSLQENTNITVYNYHEEIAGYLAGYGATKKGFTRLGFLGGIPSAQVIRFGYGYIQGIDAAAKELNQKVDIQYVYGGQFFGDSDIFTYVNNNIYKLYNTEVIFSCGGSIYTSVALAAKENNAYMIGVDSDQAPIIDRDYKEGLCITSAMKGIKQTVIDKLEALYKDGTWEGNINYLGLVSSEHPENNYVQLPLDNWRLGDFTIENYKTLLAEIMNGEKEISPDIANKPTTSSLVSVNYHKGTIK